MVEILGQQNLHPHGGAQQALGNQLGRGRRRGRLASGTGARLAIPPPPQHAAMGLHVDLDLLGIFGVGHLPQRLAAAGASAFLLGKLDHFLFGRQMAEVAPLWTFLLLLRLGLRSGRNLVVEALQMVGTIRGGLLFGFLPEELLLQTTIRATELFVLLLQDGDALEGAGMQALPITNLLPQFQILTAQRRNLTANLRHFSTQLSDQLYPVAGVRFLPTRFDDKTIHGPNRLPLAALLRKDLLRAWTGSAEVYVSNL